MTSMTSHPLQQFPSLIHQPEKKFFKSQTHQHDDHRPSQEIRGVEIDLGLLQLFADGALRHTDDLGGHSGFPTEPHGNGTGGAEESGQDISESQDTSSGESQPAENAAATAVSTGDNAPIILLTVIMAAAVLIIVWTVRKNRQNSAKD